MKASFKIKSDYRLIQHKSAKDENKKFVMYSLYMVLTSREPQHTLLNTSV